MVDYCAMGRRIRAKRRARKMSQAELAKTVNISASFYGNIERGLRVPSIDTLVAIANVLGVGTDSLLADSLKAVSSPQSREEKRILYQYFRDRVEEMDYSDLSAPDAENGEETEPSGD